MGCFVSDRFDAATVNRPSEDLHLRLVTTIVGRFKYRMNAYLWRHIKLPANLRSC
jgi:hypothetical protein